MNGSILRHASLAVVASLTAIAFSGPAQAGRSIKVDQPWQVSACEFGQSCAGFQLQANSSPYQWAYMYAQGVISFDAPIPIGADPNNPDSWGGNWFAPGFSMSANYLTGYGTSFNGFDSPRDQLFGFYAQGSTIQEVPDSDPSDDIDDFRPADFPLFDTVLFSTDGTYGTDGLFAETGAGFGYSADPLPGAIIGFRTFGGSHWVKNERGLLVGNAPSDTDFVTSFGKLVPEEYYSQAWDASTGDWMVDADGNYLFYDYWGNLTTESYKPGYTTGPTPFDLKYVNGSPDPLPVAVAVPEPASWAMMIVGFGLVGGSLRRRSGRRLATA